MLARDYSWLTIFLGVLSQEWNVVTAKVSVVSTAILYNINMTRLTLLS
jgi:hypothetical protein